MQQELTPVCKCGYEDPGNYCPNCGAKQPGRRSPSRFRRIPLKAVLAVGAVATFSALIFHFTTDDGKRPDPYREGLTTPAQALREIEKVNYHVTKKCVDLHLNDWQWTCPRVSEHQAALLVARIMSNFIVYAVETSTDAHFLEEKIPELNTEVHQTVLAMNRTTCLPISLTRLREAFLKILGLGEFIEQCNGGWKFSKQWQEVILRQQPEPAPNQLFYYEHLPPGVSQ